MFMPVGTGDPFLFNLFMALFMRAFEDQYRGHEDYRILKDKITREGVIGCDVQVKKKNPLDGSLRTVTYHVTVFDHLGYLLRGIEDVGGRCYECKGIVKVGHIFPCKECNRLFCERHLKFLDGDRDEPYCNTGWRSCYQKYKRLDEKRKELERDRLLLEKEAELADAAARRFAALKDAKKAKYDLEDLEASRPGLLSSILGVSQLSHRIRCTCGFSPSSFPVTCQSCGEAFTLSATGPRRCPNCGAVVREIQCFRCGATIRT